MSTDRFSCWRALRRLVGGLSLAAGWIAWAQAPIPLADSPYSLDVWQTESGLPQNSVAQILQTRDHYLWLGTFNGLVRFDGVRFTPFTVANTPGLRSDAVNALFEDRAGALWIGTEGGGLTRCQQGVFVTFTATNAPNANVIWSLCEDAQGGLWVGTRDGLYRFVNGQFAEPITTVGGLPVGGVHSLAMDRDGTLWFCTGSLYCRRAGQVQRVSDYVDISVMALGPRDEVWLAGRPFGLARLVGGQGTNWAGLAGKYYRSICVSPRGEVWLGGDDGVLSCWRDGLSTNYLVREDLKDKELLSLREDQEGNLWVGANGGGLHRLRPKQVRTWSKREGLFGDDVVALLRDRVGRVWVGTFEDGLTVLEAGQPHRLAGMPAKGEAVLTLCEDRQGRVWAGGYSGMLYSWRDGQVETENRGAAGQVRMVFEDREGGLWLGSSLQGVEHRAAGQVRRYSTAQGLSHGCVTAIAQDREGDLWVGTKQGLNRLHQGTVRTYGAGEGLPVPVIHSLYLDTAGTLWVGTAGGGVARYRDGRFATVTSAQGLANDVIGQMLQDEQGHFWFGSNAGIFRVRQPELLACAGGQIPTVQSMLLGRREGLRNPECAGSFQPACFRDPEGQLWFATVGGVVVVDPAQVAIPSPAPPVYIEQVTADGRSCLPRQWPAATNSTVTIPPGTARIDLRYTAVNLAAPEGVRFRFRLEGFETQWVERGRARTAYYTQVPPGSYTFRVQACNNEGVWNVTGASLGLVVQPFLWQTGGLKAAVLLILAGAGVALTRAWVSRRWRQKLELADQLNTRRRNEELGAANRALEVRTLELEAALANVKTLRGLIPICAACKKIRDDKGYWNFVEKYVQEHSEATFTHGLCPDCARHYFPDQAGGGRGSNKPSP